jgi:hypothetical protein
MTEDITAHEPDQDLYVQEVLGGTAWLAACHPDEGPGEDDHVVSVPEQCVECEEFFMTGQQVDPKGPVHVDCDDYEDDYVEQRRLLAQMDDDLDNGQL